MIEVGVAQDPAAVLVMTLLAASNHSEELPHAPIRFSRC
jgi:hypothetical protein